MSKENTMIITKFSFTDSRDHMTVEASYDVGWLEHLNCSGEGGWVDQVALNKDDAALVRIVNIRTRAKVSVCGHKGMRGMTFTTLYLTDHSDGFEINHTADSVTVACAGGFTVEYQGLTT